MSDAPSRTNQLTPVQPPPKTLLDEFAMAALTGLIARDAFHTHTIRQAYGIAYAALRERSAAALTEEKG